MAYEIPREAADHFHRLVSNGWAVEVTRTGANYKDTLGAWSLHITRPTAEGSLGHQLYGDDLAAIMADALQATAFSTKSTTTIKGERY